MHLHLCIGYLERRDGPFLGLRDFVERMVRPRFPRMTVCYNSYRDDVALEIRRARENADPTSPLVLLGHSYGASALVRAAQQLPDLTVAHLVMLDPVPRWLWGQFQWTGFHLPPNVRRATSIRNPIGLPIPAPIKSAHGDYRNLHSFVWHSRIPANARVQRIVLEIIARECGGAAGKLT